MAVATQSPTVAGFVTDMNHDGAVDTYLQGVRPLGSQFRVNTFTVNAQTVPSVGMDPDGDFTIAWQSEGQGLSYFNTIQAQRYDRNGNPLGGEFMVDTFDTTDIDFAPYVAMSHDGVIAIAWTQTSNPQNFLDHLGSGSASSYFKIYDSSGNVLVGQTGAPTGCRRSASIPAIIL